MPKKITLNTKKSVIDNISYLSHLFFFKKMQKLCVLMHCYQEFVQAQRRAHPVYNTAPLAARHHLIR